MIRITTIALFICFNLIACKNNSTDTPPVAQENTTAIDDSTVKPIIEPVNEVNTNQIDTIPDTSFIFLETLSIDFAYDMKYATNDNFLDTAIYTCDKCLIRKEVAKSLINANNKLIKQGYRIKLFDCYRPLSIQKMMWKVFPNGKYVANPKYGSIHNRGGAVDITIVHLEGKTVDMGTKFDHFGKEAHHSYTALPDSILANRKLLRSTMEASGFSAISSEWWHYNSEKAKTYPISDFETKCE